MIRMLDRVVSLACVCVAIGVWSYCANDRSDTTEKSVSSASANSDGPVVAVLDVVRVFKEHTAFLNDVKALENSLERASADFQLLQSRTDVTPGDIELVAVDKRQGFKEAECIVYANAYKRMKKAVDLYAKQAGVQIVVRFSSGDGDLTDRANVIRTINRPIVYQDGLDITDEIIHAMNFAGDAVHTSP